MVCRKCNGENDDDALFCKYCGTKLNQENICPSCNQKNDDDATFCKYCGTKLNQDVAVEVQVEEENEDKSKKKQKALNLVKWIFSIVFFGIALLLITLNFGSTFSNFIKIDVPSTYAGSIDGINIEANLFSVIDMIQNYKEVEETPISIFYAMGESGLFVYIVLLISILIAMIGTFVVLVVGAARSIYTIVTKKEYLDMKKYVALSVSILIGATLFVTLFGSKVRMSMDTVSVTVSMQMGGFVATSIWLSIAFIFLCMVYELVMNAIEKKGKKYILKSIFRIIEVALLVCLVMIAAGTCLHTIATASTQYVTNTMYLYYKNGGWFNYLNETIYSMNEAKPYFFRFKTVSGVYIPSIISLALCMALIATLAVFLAKRVCVKESKYRGSLVVGIVSASLSLAYMILAIVVITQFKANKDLIAYLSLENQKITIGASVITTFVLSILLLAEEIVGMVLIKKENQ